jgi:isopentenyl diphosphate isomerase/L-lactate dehydrogenase-like FMN-dependent dehydrogenase
MFKALAPGADAMLLGRTYAYRLAVNKQDGVKDVIMNV